MSDTAVQPPAGWYPDPQNPAGQRWWNGQTWADSNQPVLVQPIAVKNNGLAIASMVLGILWLYWVGSVLAVIFGHVALSQINKSGGTQQGRGMAIAGLVLGWVGVGTLLLVLLVAAGSTA
jgi:hypothetical protein